MTDRVGLGRAFAAAVGDWPTASKRAEPTDDVLGGSSAAVTDLRSPGAGRTSGVPDVSVEVDGG